MDTPPNSTGIPVKKYALPQKEKSMVPSSEEEKGVFSQKEISIPQKNETISIVAPIPEETQQKKRENPTIPTVFSGVPTIRTFKQDVASTIKEQKTSLIRMVLEEQKTKEKREREMSPTSKKNLPFIFLSLLLLIAGSGVVYLTFFFKNTSIFVPKTDIVLNSIISSQQNKEFPTDGISTNQLITGTSNEIKNSPIKLGSLEHLYFTKVVSTKTADGEIKTKRILTSEEIFTLLDAKLPNILSRALDTDFMFGIYALNGNQPFLILKVKLYDSAFAGMLQWEKNMPNDVLPFFGKEKDIAILETRPWEDLIIKNKDTRILRYPDSSTALMYQFKDQRTIIISRDENTLFKVSEQIDLIKEKSIP